MAVTVYDARMTSDAIREWRVQRGIGVRELARLLGVDKAQIVRWESGETRPPALLRLALAGLDAERAGANVD